MPSLSELFARGLRRVCPSCGKTPVFEKRFVLAKQCPNCGWEIRAKEDNTYFFMYMSTAAMTGVVIILMFLIHPTNIWLGRLAVGLGASLLFYTTHSTRKSLALAFEFYMERQSQRLK